MEEKSYRLADRLHQMGLIRVDEELHIETLSDPPKTLLTVGRQQQIASGEAWPKAIRFKRIRGRDEFVYIAGCIHDPPACKYCTCDVKDDIKDETVFKRFRSSLVAKLWRTDKYVVGKGEI